MKYRLAIFVLSALWLGLDFHVFLDSRMFLFKITTWYSSYIFPSEQVEHSLGLGG